MSWILHECLIHVQFRLCDHWKKLTPKSDKKRPMRIPQVSLNLLIVIHLLTVKINETVST